MTSSAILIPARYESTRFPGKPLAMLENIPMIKRVYEKCKATGIDTYVLTDDQRIYNAIGPDCIIDKAPYENGTERCSGAVLSRTFDDYDHIVNVQGDMPDVTEELIRQCLIQLSQYAVSTVYTEMPKEEQERPSSVKLVRSDDKCLWFGRGMTGYGDWHLGVYGYTREALKIYNSLPVPKEEHIEKLEQLRWLKRGWNIGCKSVYFKGVEINTPEDVDVWHSKNYQ